jgi:hypothetical protein
LAIRQNNRNHSIPGSFAFTGALSGFVSTFLFTVVHQIFISNIWFSFVFMAGAGILSGFLIAMGFGILFRSYTSFSWFSYNSIFLVMFLLLALFSVIVFEPVTTMGELLQANGPPDDLIRKAFPMTILFTIAFAVIISVLYAKKLLQVLMVVITCAELMLVLGLNVSVIGLVDIPRTGFHLIMELFGLILLILFMNAIIFRILESKHFT